MLTAHHCISSSAVASSLEAYFDFETTNCVNYPTSNGEGCPSQTASDVSGASIVSTGSASDFTLLQLWEAPPIEQIFLGWKSNPVAFSNGTPLYRFSHGKGGPMQHSQQSVDTNAGQCSGLPRGNIIYSKETLGATVVRIMEW